MKKIILIGAGGHAKSCIDVIESEKKFKIIGLIDNKRKENILNYKILGDDKILLNLYKSVKYAFITVGHLYEPNIRVKIYKKLNRNQKMSLL